MKQHQLQEMEQMRAAIADQVNGEKERVKTELDGTWLDDNDLMDIINQVCFNKYQQLAKQRVDLWEKYQKTDKISDLNNCDKLENQLDGLVDVMEGCLTYQGYTKDDDVPQRNYYLVHGIMNNDLEASKFNHEKKLHDTMQVHDEDVDLDDLFND